MIESRYACYIVNRSPISVDDKNRRFRSFYSRISTHVRIYKQIANSRLSDIFSSIILSSTNGHRYLNPVSSWICLGLKAVTLKSAATCVLVIRLRSCKLKHSCVIRALFSFDSSIIESIFEMLILGTRLIKKCCFQEQDEMSTLLSAI